MAKYQTPQTIGATINKKKTALERTGTKATGGGLKYILLANSLP